MERQALENLCNKISQIIYKFLFYLFKSVSFLSILISQLVGQFAKWTGCYVVGSAGSKEKVFLKFLMS